MAFLQLSQFNIQKVLSKKKIVSLRTKAQERPKHKTEFMSDPQIGIRSRQRLLLVRHVWY